jgi:PKD repeat protein
MKLRKCLLYCIVVVIALLWAITPVSAVTNVIPQGGDVFIGEQGLNVTAAVGGYAQIAWFMQGTNPNTDVPNAIYTIGDPSSFYVASSNFLTKTGTWYRWNGANQGQAFNVVDPSLTIRIWDQDTQTEVSGAKVSVGSTENFRIETNMYSIASRPGFNPVTDGMFTIRVQTPDGGILTSLFDITLLYANYQIPLTSLNVNANPYYWVSTTPIAPDWYVGWYTAAMTTYSGISGTRIYPDGTYTAWIDCNVNHINENYNVEGKTISIKKTVTIESRPLSVKVNKGSLKRGETFSATVSGDPFTQYVIWVKSATCSGTMSGYPCDQPPMISYNLQEGVAVGTNGDQIFDCSGCIKTVEADTPDYPDGGIWYYATVTTDVNGTRTVDWQTSTDTKPGTYTIAVIPVSSNNQIPVIPKTTTVTVNKGTVTLTAYVFGKPVSQAYLGDTIRLTGTNTDSTTTYLFISGPCQACEGSDLVYNDPVETGEPCTFTQVPVKPDGSWEYLWITKDNMIDLGQYYIYAVSKPDDRQSLENLQCVECSPVTPSCAAWAKIPFEFLKPTITADINPKVLKIVCCEPISIIVNGSATGIWDYYYNGESGWVKEPIPIAFWVFGENKVSGYKYIYDQVDVDCPDDTFSFNLANYFNTLALQPGTYKVVLQHPMYNHLLDVIPEDWVYYPTWDTVWSGDPNKEYVITSDPVRWSKLFLIDGTGRLAGFQALQALIDGLNARNIDDTYLLLEFKVESNTAVIADFSGTPTTGAKPLAVQFTDISTGNPTTWLWNFGDGTTSVQQNPLHTYQNEGSYDVSLSVTNAVGSSTTTKADYITVTSVGPTPTPTGTVTPTPGTNTIDLWPGWNFVSTPKALADSYNTASEVFGGVNTGGHSIYLYDASTGIWTQMMADTPVKPLDGIWIYSTTATQVTLHYKNDPLATPPTKQMYTGWNAIGFSDTTSLPAKDTLLSVGDQWTQEMGFNAAMQTYEPAIIKGSTAPNHADTTPMFPTKGYWLYMTGPGTLAAISA